MILLNSINNKIFNKSVIILFILLPLFFNNVNAGNILFPPVPPPTSHHTPTPKPSNTPKPLPPDSYGGPVNGDRPSWIERANHYLVNALRIDPQGYKKNYFKGGENLPNVLKAGGIYKPVTPLYYRLDLDKAALFHTKDMANTPCFSHNDCNGGNVIARLRSYLKGCGNPNQKYSSIAENIVKVYSDPLEANNFWICEQAPVGKLCVNDGANDGHRSNLLNEDMRSIGIAAVVSKKDSYTYWTQDFDSEVCPLGEVSPIHSGSHIIDPKSKKCQYAVTFFSDELDNSNQVVKGTLYINDKPTDLQLLYGKQAKGVFIYQTSKYSKSDKYYFEFNVTNSKTHTSKSFRYPEKGLLVTITDFKDNSPSWVKN